MESGFVDLVHCVILLEVGNTGVFEKVSPHPGEGAVHVRRIGKWMTFRLHLACAGLLGKDRPGVGTCRARPLPTAS